jgi:hypothetical protein
VGSGGLKDYPTVGLPRFFPWSDIDEIEEDDGVVLQLRNGTKRRISSLYITGIDQKSLKQRNENHSYVVFLRESHARRH